MADFLQTLISAITLGSLYALIALGYTMVYGILKLINFAHSDVVVLGAWTSLTISAFALPRLGVDLNAAPWWAGVVVLLLTTGVCALAGLLIERLAYKPIRGAPRLNALITAMGVSLLMQNAGQLQYTVVDGATTIASGNVVARGQDPKKVTLDSPVTIAPGTAYLLQITPAGATVPLERRVTAEPGTYATGDALTLGDSVGRSQAKGATFKLVTRSTSLKLPFGKMPAAVPDLMPPLTHADDASMRNVLLTIPFSRSITSADGTVRTIETPVRVRLVHVVIIATAMLLMIGLELLVFHTRLGTAMRAVSYNTDYAALMGIPINRVISITFVIGAVLAAAAGFLYGQMYGQLQQTAHYAWTLLGLKAFVAAVVGGIGNVRGATVGGFLIAFIELFGGLYGTYFFQNASAYTDVAVFVLLIVVLIVKPSGLFGSTAREKV